MNEMIRLNSNKRKTELYLRALWAQGFTLCAAESEQSSDQPFSYISDNNIYLSEQVSLKNNQHEYYRAAATHAALHSIYKEEPIEKADYNLMQRSLIGLVEDLRVELLAIQQFPGLRGLWLQFHPLYFAENNNAQALMSRLSRSVLDPGYEDSHQWVNKGRQLILEKFQDLKGGSFCLQTGLQLANDLGQMRLPLNSGKYEQEIFYRDDNSWLWFETTESHSVEEVINQTENASMLNNRLQQQKKGKQLQLSENQGSRSEGFYINDTENPVLEYQQYNTASAQQHFLYPEWDYRIQLMKTDFCHLTEMIPVEGSLEKIDHIFNKHRFVLNRLRHLAKQLQTEKKQRIRKIEDGDELDLNPLVNAAVSMRNNTMPDTRVFMRNNYRKEKELAISILLDLSESTNEITAGSTQSISEQIRDSVLLLGETLTIADESFSIAGFNSNGRHDIQYIKYKDFDQSFETSKAHLANVRGQYSTRLGAAIRHCSAGLSQQSERKKVLLVITDGIPADIDVFDTDYLQHDSHQAIQSLPAFGIKPFCINLDSQSGSVTEHIFGRGHFQTIDSINRLPEVLASLYLKNLRY